MDSTAAAAAFTRLTELADLLLNAGGELGIYSHRKEQLERFAKAVLPQTDILASSAGGGDDGDDMFADEDDAVISKPDDAKKDDSTPKESPAAAGAAAAAAGAGGGVVQQQGSAAGSSGPPAAAAADVVDYSSWPVKELRRLLTERGVDSSSIVEKGDLVNEVRLPGDGGRVAGMQGDTRGWECAEEACCCW
jgi:hypothetical protein